MITENESQIIKIAIIDDHKLLADGLKEMINSSNKAHVTNIYNDLASARLGLAESLPDILFLDIGLPDGDGVDFCAEIKEIYRNLKIIILTTYKEFNLAKRALNNGALGYILKNADSEEMFAGIAAVSKGKRFLCEEIDVMMEKRKNEDVIWLSMREKQVLQHIADGYTTNEIANLMFLKSDTIHTHRKNLFIKLDAKNMAVLLKKANEMKLIW